MNIQQFFKIGLDRDIPELLAPTNIGRGIDLGASGTKKTLPDALGAPDWVWPRDPIPAHPATIKVFHCFHFLEHLTGEDAIALLRAMETALEPGGVINIVVPYYNSSMQAHDLTHKSQYNEGTFPNLFKNAYYDMAGEWRLSLHTQFIMGIVERNMALFVQLTKDS